MVILTCVTPKALGLRYWAKLVGGLVLLGYIGYAVFVIAPALILSYWYESRETLTSKARSLLILGPIGVGIYAPQLHVFLTVHVHNSESQFSSLFRKLVGIYVAQIYDATQQLAVGYALITVLLSVIGVLTAFTGIILHALRLMFTEFAEHK